MRKLTSEEKVALRRVASSSLTVAPKLVNRLVQLQLVHRVKDGLGLTPLGRREYQRLPRAPLLQKAPAYIDGILTRAIRWLVQLEYRSLNRSMNRPNST